MADEASVLLRRLRADLVRVGVVMALATAMLMGTTPLAVWLGEPALAPWGMWTALSLYAVAFVQVLRRLMFPYVDLRAVFLVAMKTETGPGYIWLGVCFVIGCLLLTIGTAARASSIPPGALQHLPTLGNEIARHWPAAPDWALLAGQVEQESCITLKHPRCWNPRAELRTARERGVGFGQITKTHRFDALSELRAQFPKELEGWAWDSHTLYDPAYQLRALVLMDRRNFGAITGAGDDRMVMALVAYNGGLGGLASDRRLCAATKGCDPSRWWGHVERTSLKARTVAAGYGKSFFEINREYPRLIIQRAVKYRPLMGA